MIRYEYIIDIELPAARDKNLELIFKCTDDVPEVVLGDNTGLYRILLNLVGNAIKFTPKGFVKITVRVARKTDSNKLLLKFIVQDTGIGIPIDKKDSIYDRFTRCTPSNQGLYPGSGLGLCIVKQLVTDLGGEIKVESELGQGTTFTCFLPFELPLTDTSQAIKPEKKVTPKPLKKNQYDWHVLLVEDDLLAQRIASFLLENNCQCRVDLAKTGREAIQVVQSKEYNLVFMDLGLPDMSGYDVAKKIRSLNQVDLPIIALTAHAADSAEQAARAVGMNDFVTKPLDIKSARHILNKWCSTRETENA